MSLKGDIAPGPKASLDEHGNMIVSISDGTSVQPLYTMMLIMWEPKKGPQFLEPSTTNSSKARSANYPESSQNANAKVHSSF